MQMILEHGTSADSEFFRGLSQLKLRSTRLCDFVWSDARARPRFLDVYDFVTATADMFDMGPMELLCAYVTFESALRRHGLNAVHQACARQLWFVCCALSKKICNDDATVFPSDVTDFSFQLCDFKRAEVIVLKELDWKFCLLPEQYHLYRMQMSIFLCDRGEGRLPCGNQNTS